ncbi:MAG TPA: hypothetical protein VKB38_17200 [Terracidiphilus sp.]|nr:hypothetical protein [Terracidiphilus sp.]
MTGAPKLNSAWWTLRIGLGVGPICSGLDKYFNRLTQWDMYLNPLVPKLLHISAPGFMHIVGVVEIIAGIIVLARFTRLGAYIVMAWLWAIALSLIAQGQFLDIAVRDIEMSLGAFALAKLTEAREPVLESVPSRAPETLRHLA